MSGNNTKNGARGGARRETPAVGSQPEGTVRGAGATLKYEQKRMEIATAAAECFEARGVARTTLVDISKSYGITRELIYYYFANKASIVDAVVDLYAQRMSAQLLAWARRWNQDTALRIEVQAESLRDLVQTLRAITCEPGGTRAPMMRVLNEADAIEDAVTRASYIVAGSSSQTTPHALAFVVFGVVGLLFADCNRQDDDIVRAMWQFFKRDAVAV